MCGAAVAGCGANSKNLGIGKLVISVNFSVDMMKIKKGLSAPAHIYFKCSYWHIIRKRSKKRFTARRQPKKCVCDIRYQMNNSYANIMCPMDGDGVKK